MIEGPRLAALVASRVCHDMAEPMNALIQGIEMLKESEAAAKNADAIGLMEHGVNKAWAKLEFFRFAFGSAATVGGDDEGLVEEARPTAEKLYASLKPALKWEATGIRMPRACLKVLMNALWIANECLPKGGVVTVAPQTHNSGIDIVLTCDGVRAGMRAPTKAALNGQLPEDGYHGPVVQPLLTGILARQANMEILTRQGETQIEIVLRAAAFKR
jgi:histidine phosphotransferase ChpT